MLGLGLEGITGVLEDTTNTVEKNDPVEGISRGSKPQNALSGSDESGSQKPIDLYRIKIRVSNEQAPSGCPEDGQQRCSSELMKEVESLLSEFPPPPNHIPAQSEAAASQTAYSNMSTAAMKVVNFGLGSLRRGFADKWLSKK
jgi:hypothetical protein